MLRPRVIPCLLLTNGRLVKTIRFADATYVGDPINAVRIFNEKECDELVLLDIGATARGEEPDFKRVATLSAECRMPLCYGGGITTVEQAKRMVGLGVEKVAVSAAATADPPLIARMADALGCQSVVVALDVRPGKGGSYEVWTHNGTRNTGKGLEQAVAEAESLGAGEILVNAIERDGVMEGYDLELARRTRGATRLPMTVLGGAGSLDDLGRLIGVCGVVGAAAGSLFVFKGPYRAVLITYPSHARKRELFRRLVSVPA
jgi:cyclase